MILPVLFGGSTGSYGAQMGTSYQQVSGSYISSCMTLPAVSVPVGGIPSSSILLSLQGSTSVRVRTDQRSWMT
jgi:hypothetical protein